MSHLSRRVLLAAAALAPAAARALPPAGGTITLVVGAAPGGTTDTLAREIAPLMAERLGRSVVVENRAGAGGNIAALAVARARPDGSTLLVAFTSHTLNTVLQKSLPYHPLDDFTPITLLGRLGTAVLVIRPGLTERDLASFLAAAKADPARFSFAIGALGSSLHMQTVLVRAKLGLSGPEVVFRGTAPAIADVAGDRVDAMFAPLDVARPLIEAGRVRPIAVTGGKRSVTFPDLPALEELVPGLPPVAAWFGLLGPAGMPAATVAALHEAVRAALDTPRLQARMAQAGGEVGGMDPMAFRAFLERDLALWADIARLGNITPE